MNLNQSKRSGEVRHERLKIPADLALHVTRQQAFREFQVFLWLKCHYSDRCKFCNQLLKEVSQGLQIDPRTVRRAIERLKKRNWFGFNPVTKTIYPRSFDTIRRMEKMDSRKAFLFNSKDLEHTKAFTIAAAISILLIRKRYSLRNRGHRLNSRRNGIRSIKLGQMAPIAAGNEYLSKHLQISKSTASEYKDIAAKARFINRERSYERLDSIIKKLPKKIEVSPRSASLLEESFSELKGRIRIIGKTFFVQRPDRLSSNLIACKRKGQNPIKNMGYRKGPGLK